jgi:RHS repeat-associated protein
MRSRIIRRIAVVLIAALSLTIRSSMGQDQPDTNPPEISPATNTDLSTDISTGSGYDAWTGSVRRVVHDIYPVPGALGYGHLAYTRTYSSWFTAVQGSEDFPGGWAASYSWRIDGIPTYTDGLHVTFPDGRQEVFSGNNDINGETFGRAGPGTKERLEQIGGFGVNGTVNLYLEDGSVVHFDRIFDPADPEGGQPYPIETFIPRWVRDPHGLITMLNYLPIPPGADWDVRLDSVVDPTGRKLQFHYDDAPPHGPSLLLVSVTASDGQSVTYSSNENGFNDGAKVDTSTYSDSTHATYKYNAPSTTRNDAGTHVVLQYRLGTAQDTHAEGPMRSVEYSYKQNARPGLGGQISTESYFDGTNAIPVSTYVHSNPPGRQTETRGDGAFSRSFNVIKVRNDKIPLLMDRTDFNGHNEYFGYDDNFYLNSFRDFLGYETTFVNERFLGRPTTVTHPAGSFADGTTFDQTTTLYNYGPDSNFPYFVYSVTDDRSKVTTYERYPRIAPPTSAAPPPAPSSSPSEQIHIIHYPYDAGDPQPTETFEYNSFGEVTKHQLKNGYYEHATYDDATHLLTAQWNPTIHSEAQDDDPHSTYTYYTANDISAWRDRVNTVTDPRGNRTQYEYDISPSGVPIPGRGLVTKITYMDDPHGPVSQSFTYDVYGNKLSETNELTKTTHYFYDDYNRLTKVTLPPTTQIPDPSTIYDYTPVGRSPYSHTTKTVRLETSPSNVATTSTYDNNLRLQTKAEGSQDPSSQAITQYAYDLNGNLRTVTDPRVNVTTTDYDSRNRKIQVTTAAPFSLKTQWKYDAGGNVTSIIRPDTTLETKSYDAMNRVRVDTVPKSGTPSHVTESVATTFTYNPSGTIQSVMDGENHTTAFEYDPSDVKTKMIYPNGTDYQQWTYDANHNLIARRTVNVNPKSQLFSYDARNRQFAMAWSDGADWSNFGYDAAGHLTSAINPTSTIIRGYDEAGRMTLDEQTLHVLPVSAVSRKTHGSVGTFDITLPLAGSMGVECRLGQGANSDQHQIIVIFPRAVTVGSAQVSSGTGSVASTSTSTDGTQVTINLAGVTNAQSIVVTLSNVTDGIATNDVQVGMTVLLGDTTGNGSVDSSDVSQVKGQLGQQLTTSNFREDVNLDGSISSADKSIIQSKIGTVASGTVPEPPNSKSPPFDVQYEYRADGKQTHLYVPGAGYDYTFGYDTLGRFQTISPTGQNPAFQYSYDLASNEKLRTNNLNGVSQDYGTADQLNRMVQRDVKAGAATISHEAYAHDSTRPGLLTSVTRDYAPNQTQDVFTYDLLPELTNAQYGGSTPRTCSYVFDRAGNRKTMTDSGGPNHNYGTPTLLNQYLTDGTNPITSGSEHEMANYQNVSYAYINDTHLSSVSGTDVFASHSTYQMSYDALGRCAVRILNGVTTSYIYDGEKAILEYQSWSGPSAKNLYGRSIDEILMRTDYPGGSSRTIYYQDDHEGSITHLMNAQGIVIEKYTYDAFGKPTITDGSGSVLTTGSAYGNRFMFTGREYVVTFGIYEYRNRAYHPGLGRFMSEDPKGFDGGDYNLFRYCHDDPEDLTDPMGLEISGVDPWMKKDVNEALRAQGKTVVGGLIMAGTRAEGSGHPDQQQQRDLTAGRSKLPIPKTQYDKISQAGDAAVKNIKKVKDELVIPISQVDGNDYGHYVSGGTMYGGIRPAGEPTAGKQGTDIKHITDYVPEGTHLVGYATVHPRRDWELAQRYDIPTLREAFNIQPRIVIKVPGYDGRWEKADIKYLPQGTDF